MQVEDEREDGIAVDEPADAPAEAACGPAAIRRFARLLPNQPGVYRMIDAQGRGALCRQGAEPEEAGGQLHPRRRPHQPHRAHDRAHREHGVRHHRDRGRSAAARDQSDQAAEAALQRHCCATTSRSPRSSSAATIRSPQLAKHRGARSRKGDYFGPFASAGAVNRTINTLQKAFLLRSCSDSVYESRTRPCMLHQIKRCSAPCTGLIALEDYAIWWRRREAFLRGKSRAVQGGACRADGAGRRRLDFERRRASATASGAGFVTAQQGDQSRDGRGGRCLRPRREGGQACVQVFFFRAGQNWGNRAYFPRVDRTTRGRRGPRRLPRPVLRRQADPEADPGRIEPAECAAAWRRPSTQRSRPQGGDRRAAARREAAARRPCR